MLPYFVVSGRKWLNLAIFVEDRGRGRTSVYWPKFHCDIGSNCLLCGAKESRRVAEPDMTRSKLRNCQLADMVDVTIANRTQSGQLWRYPTGAGYGLQRKLFTWTAFVPMTAQAFDRVQYNGRRALSGH